MKNQSNNNQVKLSIVMPVYNHLNLVEEMIDSIIANDFQDWKLLAIDDGSTEDIHKIIEKYQNDSRIEFIARRRTPKGAQTCRNIGLELATGEYIIFFDSDDYIAPYCLSQRVNAMEANKDADVIVFPSGTYFEGEFHKEASLNVYGYPIFKDDIQAFAEKNLPYIVWNNIYRTGALREHHIMWDEKLLSLQDSDFNLQVLLHGLKTIYAKNSMPDYAYRIENQGKSVSKKISSKEHLKSHIYHLRKDINSIQTKFGHKYDKYLHRGNLFIYNRSMTFGLLPDFANQLVSMEKDFHMKSYPIFKIQVITNKLLDKFLPAKIARQVTMLRYLLKQKKDRQYKIQNISSINENNN